MMHRAGALAASWEMPADRSRRRRPAARRARDSAGRLLPGRLRKAQNVSQDRRARRRVFQEKLTPRRPRIACSTGISLALQPGSFSMPGVATNASRVPSPSLKEAPSHRIFSQRFPWAAPFATSRWVQYPIDASGMRKTVS